MLFLLGLIWGSFLSVFSYRYPRQIQFLAGRSFCPKCKSKISWFDNIPLLSYIFLGGKCRRCGKKISLRYPIIELVTGIAFTLLWPDLTNLIIFSILFLIFIIDLEHQIIPDSLVFLGLLFSPFANLQAGFLAATFLLLIHLVTRGKGMGLGDVKFAVLGGALTSMKLMPLWLFLSFLTGAAVSIILVLWRKKNLKDKIAFGPFLVIAIPASLWLSSLSLFRSYLSSFLWEWPF